jgi:sulfite exporter TauE/SafE
MVAGIDIKSIKLSLTIIKFHLQSYFPCFWIYKILTVEMQEKSAVKSMMINLNFNLCQTNML